MKAILRSGFLALAIMALAVPTNAGPLEGLSRAIHNFNREGRGVSQDHAEAVKWYRLAVGQGHAGAQASGICELKLTLTWTISGPCSRDDLMEADAGAIIVTDKAAMAAPARTGTISERK